MILPNFLSGYYLIYYKYQTQVNVSLFALCSYQEALSDERMSI